jgi:lipoprotein-anchoring transpeptidase ErfK/SrfK
MKRPHESNRLTKIAALLAIAIVEASAQDDKTTRRIVVSIPDRKLALLEGERVLKIYDVAVGKPATPSPHGEFKIVSRAIDPVWKGVPPGPNNPVGTRWLGLSAKGYGIHGTNAPSSIGKAASHGCIRMRNRDVEELFGLVGPGLSVELAEQRPEMFARIFAELTPQNAEGGLQPARGFSLASPAGLKSRAD